MNLPWFKFRDHLIASKCTDHPETGWLAYEAWRSHIWNAHPGQNAEDVPNSYRWCETKPDGMLRLGRLIRHMEDGVAYRGIAPGVKA